MDRPARILSIEDEATVRRSIVAYLEDSGYEMLEAENGRAGLQLFIQEKPDVVLCDLRMPELDGLSVLAEVGKYSPETPFIIVSGTGDMRDAVEALKLGAWDFITKPITDMGVLDHSVKKALDQARLVRENHEYRENLIETNRRLRESLRQLEEDETAARRVQFQLLPEPVLNHDGYEFSRYLKPSAFLSGDFVDYFQIDETHWGFYIADVSGHGAASAFVTVMLKSMMTHLLDQSRLFENDTILHTDRVLTQLSQKIFKQDLGKYLTMFYGVLDFKAGTMTYSNGGQFPRPILFDGKSARYIEEGTLPVGLFENTVYTPTTIELPNPFLLAMFSDGVFEILPEEGLKDPKQSVLELIGGMDVTMEGLVERLKLESIEAPDDDVTLLLVKKDG